MAPELTFSSRGIRSLQAANVARQCDVDGFAVTAGAVVRPAGRTGVTTLT